MSRYGSSRKRRLLDSSSLSFASPASSVESLKSSAENDELRLVNEQLQDELRSAQDELDRAKERHARQIEFLEEENAKMKKATGEARSGITKRRRNGRLSIVKRLRMLAILFVLQCDPCIIEEEHVQLLLWMIRKVTVDWSTRSIGESCEGTSGAGSKSCQ